MTIRATTREAYRLLHDGALVMSRIEANGIRMDVGRMDSSTKEVTSKISELEAELRNDKVFKSWSNAFGHKTNLASDEQLRHIIYDVLGFPKQFFTERSYERDGSLKADATAKVNIEALELIDHPFVHKFLKFKKFKKCLQTIGTIRREMVDGVVHPFFELHTTVTWRSSSRDFNGQNIPRRDKEVAGFIRCFFVPHEDDILVEVDFRGAEVVVGAAYHKDPVFIKYLRSKGSDMHWDVGKECFLLSEEEMHKVPRDITKNKFVFPEFYGSFYPLCARSVWNAISLLDMKTKSGLPMKKHLAKHGIKRLGDCDPRQKPKSGTFEKHFQGVEERLWTRFKGYRNWRQSFWEEYQKNLGFAYYTGFYAEGVYSRNNVFSYAIQGSSFHCLLWSLIQVQAEFDRRKMKTKIIAQIHDSGLFSVPKKELESFLEIAKQVTTVDLMRHWQWLIVPMEIEVECAPNEGSWFDKKQIDDPLPPKPGMRLGWDDKEGKWQWN